MGAGDHARGSNVRDGIFCALLRSARSSSFSPCCRRLPVPPRCLPHSIANTRLHPQPPLLSTSKMFSSSAQQAPRHRATLSRPRTSCWRLMTRRSCTRWRNWGTNWTTWCLMTRRSMICPELEPLCPQGDGAMTCVMGRGLCILAVSLGSLSNYSFEMGCVFGPLLLPEHLPPYLDLARPNWFSYCSRRHMLIPRFKV